MSQELEYILAVDPGKMTGVSGFVLANGEDPVLDFSDEVTMDQFAGVIRDRLVHPRGLPVVVACETFTINAQTAKNSQAPYSLEMIGVLRQCLRDENRSAEDIYFQSPANAKSMFSNEALKRLGYWHRGGAGHALDSIRHGLLLSVRRGWKPVKLLADS